MSNTSIGKEIKKVRRDQEITQAQLVEMCGNIFTQKELSFYENDKNLPSKERLEIIAKALGKEWKLNERSC